MQFFDVVVKPSDRAARYYTLTEDQPKITVLVQGPFRPTIRPRHALLFQDDTAF